jgi:hypothetical protein
MNCASASGKIIARADRASLGAAVPVTRSPATLEPLALFPVPSPAGADDQPLQLNTSDCSTRFTQGG